MEKIKNKAGKVVSYREKIYVNGKTITKTFKRKSDAANWKKTQTAEMQRREALGIGHIQSIEFESFARLWLEMKRDQGLARRTIDSYGAAIRRYLIPSLGKIKLEKINQGHAQQVIQLSRSNGLGHCRINLNLKVLKQMLGDAVKLNHMVRNPLSGMRKIKEPPRSLSYWLPHQIERFLAANQSDPLYPIFAFALNTGLRRGEILGLCWDKVNPDKRRIEISRIRDRYGLKDTTKTGEIRHLPLNDSAWKILARLSESKNHDRFVFALEGGKLPDIYHLSSRPFQRAIQRANVPKIRFHDLRTTYASNFVMAGGDIFVLSKLLGHTSVEMTAKKYAALHPRFMQEVVQTVEFGANSPDLAHNSF